MTDQPNPVAAFSQTLARDWPDGLGVDGEDLIHIAVRTGLLVEETVRRPCGDQCRCLDAYDPHEWVQGVICYRINPRLKEAA
jgi:hypothetical protein